MRWHETCQRWVRWKQRLAARFQTWTDPAGAERRAARLLRFWGRRG